MAGLFVVWEVVPLGLVLGVVLVGWRHAGQRRRRPLDRHAAELRHLEIEQGEWETRIARRADWRRARSHAGRAR